MSKDDGLLDPEDPAILLDDTEVIPIPKAAATLRDMGVEDGLKQKEWAD